MGLFTIHGILGGIANQTFWITHFIHYVVTNVDTSGTTNTLILQTIPNINAGGADLNTQGTINAVAQTQCFRIGFTFTGTARFTTVLVIGNNQGVLVEHGALKTRIWAHVDTDLFA